MLGYLYSLRLRPHRLVLGLLYLAAFVALAHYISEGWSYYRTKVTTLFNSQPESIEEGKVVLRAGGELRELPNDYVFIFAGGVPPFELLKRAGIRMGGA